MIFSSGTFLGASRIHQITPARLKRLEVRVAEYLYSFWRTDADREVWGIARPPHRGGHGRRGRAGCDGAGWSRTGADRRNHLWLRSAGGWGAECGAADFGAQRGTGGSSRVHRQQGLRVGTEVDRAGVSVDSGWRRQLHSGWRDGVDVAGSLLSRWGAVGIPAGQSGDGGRNVSRRIFLSAGEDGDGRDRRGAGRAVQDFARGAGRIRVAVADARGAGDCGGAV